MVTVVLNRDLPENSEKPNTFGYFRDSSADPTYYAPIVITPELAIKGLKIYKGPSKFAIKSTGP